MQKKETAKTAAKPRLRLPRPARIDIVATLKQLHKGKQIANLDIETDERLRVTYEAMKENPDYDEEDAFSHEFESRDYALRGADVAEFPGCCGITILENLDFTDDSDDGDFPGSETQGHTLLYSAAADRLSGLVLASTIKTQKEAIAGLRAAGFEVLKTFTNPGSNNEVTLWGKVGRG